MYGIDPKSLLIGAVIGYFVAPRVVGFVAGKIAAAKPAPAK